MNFVQQLRGVAVRRINEAFARSVSLPTMANRLAVQAFIERWSENELDTQIVRHALDLLNTPGKPFIPPKEPALELTVVETPIDEARKLFNELLPIVDIEWMPSLACEEKHSEAIGMYRDNSPLLDEQNSLWRRYCHAVSDRINAWLAK